ncbi:MAG: hypothetical protein AABY22_05705, partial [Nanoarchaeota archaeon]
KEITLEYKFIGNCGICNGELDTIKVEFMGGERDIMIAYCPKDRRQWKKQEVLSIEKQFISLPLIKPDNLKKKK